MQRTKNGNLEIFDHPARIALDMATTREGKKRSATEMVYICSSSCFLAVYSRDLPSVEKKITVAKPDQILKIPRLICTLIRKSQALCKIYPIFLRVAKAPEIFCGGNLRKSWDS